MIQRVRGLIISYQSHSKKGVLLLNRKRAEDFEDHVRTYIKGKSNSNFWFAKFTWSVISERDRDDVCSHIQRVNMDDSEGPWLSLDGFMRGIFVCCDVERTPRWEVTAMRLDRGRRRARFSQRRENEYLLQKAPLPAYEANLDDALGRRLYRAHLRKPNNLRRPFRG